MKMQLIVKNVSIQLRYAQYNTMIYNCTVKCYAHTNSIIENIYISSLTSLRNGFVLETSIYEYPFINELEIDFLGSI